MLSGRFGEKINNQKKADGVYKLASYRQTDTLLKDFNSFKELVNNVMMSTLTFELAVSARSVESGKVGVDLIRLGLGGARGHLEILRLVLADVLLGAVVKDALHTEALHPVNIGRDGASILKGMMR